MRITKIIIIALCSLLSCGVIEESPDIPKPGIYTSTEGRSGYESRLTISKAEKGYSITLAEYKDDVETAICIIDASGKKSSYGIWVEVPAYGPRMPVIITKRDDVLDVSLKGPEDPKETFTYCLTDRSPVGTYESMTE